MAANSSSDLTRRVAWLAADHIGLCLALALYAVSTHASFGSPRTAALLTVTLIAVGMLPMHLEFGRATYTLTIPEALHVVALFTLGPLGVMACAAVAELVACVTQGISRLKIVYNTVNVTVAALAAALTFRGLGGVPHRHESWMAAAVGMAVFFLCNHVSMSLVLAVVEHRNVFAILADSALSATVTTGLAVSVGLAVHALLRTAPAAPLLLAPLVMAAFLETRALTTHRTEHLRFKRLYDASSRTTGLQGGFEAALRRAAEEARSLATGSAALCCGRDRSGTWRGVLVDDTGFRPAPDDAVTALVRVSGDFPQGEAPTAPLAPVLRQVAPDAATIVVATSKEDAPSGVVVAVFRAAVAREKGEARAEVLAAFVVHAALTVANALLYEEVEEALRHQVDLNRQKDDFLAAVSHELRTPLAAMLGSVSTLTRLDHRLSPEDKQRFLVIAARQGKRLQRLIEELLLTAALDERSQGCTLETVDLPPLLHELVDDLGELAGGRIQVAVLPGGEQAASEADLLRQVLVNLVENAAKYAPEGPIEVTASPGPAGRVVLRVVDHGPGIPADDRERVFERFVQLDQSSTRARGGTGLGLYLCRRLVSLLGATLVLSSTPGGGCTFTIEVPAIARERKAAADARLDAGCLPPVRNCGA